MVRNHFDLILCSHAKWRKTSSPILPDEIIYDILLLLPGDILYNVMRYVCGHWYTIIRDPGFLTKHLTMSTATLLMHMVRRLPHEVICSFEHRIFHDFRLLDVTNCDAKLTAFRFKLPCKAKLMSTCNGLLLMDANIPRNLFYVGNPATRRMLPLPPLSKFMYRPTNIHPYCCLAYAASCKVYKVLVVFQDLRLRKGSRLVYEYGELISPMSSPWVNEDRRLSKGSPFGCAILTVGIDKEWRVLNLTDNKFLCDQPLSSTGFIYWPAQLCPYILALDVESESIKSIALPYIYDESNYLAPKGNSISFWQVNPDLSMEVWVLKDHKTEEWVKCSYVEGEAMRNELESFLLLNELSPWSEYYRSVHPRSWLGNCEKILFHIEHSAFCRNGRFFVYDLKTRACTDVELKFTSVCGFIPFINSLAWI